MIEPPKVGDSSLVYMYGISDFWVDIFGDRDLVEAVLSSTTVSLAEVYSYFIQRASGISLENIQERYKTRIKLLLIDEDSEVEGSNGTEFKIDPSIEKSLHLSNRPILPTQTLDDSIHYEIIDGIIKFYRPLADLKFPVRYTSEQKAQYALWLSDAEIDEKWIDESFGKLVGFTEEDAIFNYKSFLEGVYYLYTNGPNIAYIERGVNLAMGMPYARITEEVRDMSQDAVTGNWVVFTESQAYEMPYGYRPELVIGDVLEEGKVISTWVEIKDYVRNGAWWYDIYLPKEVLSRVEDPIAIGRCIEGSAGDRIMRTSLSSHMFEVLITQPSGDITSFNTARNLVLYSKPEYTFPVFVWRVPIEDELIHLDDDSGFKYDLGVYVEDTCVSPPSIRKFLRSVNDPEIFTRGKSWYNRYQGSFNDTTLLGYGDWKDNAGWVPEVESVSDRDLNILTTTMRNRGDTVTPITRGTITRGWRGYDKPVENLGYEWKIPGNKVFPRQADEFTVSDREIIPLYMLTTNEIRDKIRTVSPGFNVNVKDNYFVVKDLNLVDTFDTWMRRENTEDIISDDKYDFIFNKGSVDIALSPYAKQAYAPSMSDVMRDGAPITDGIIFISRNIKDTWTVHWYRNYQSNAPTIFPVMDADHTIAFEDYDYEKSLGETSVAVDQYLHKGQLHILSPVLLGVTGNAIVFRNDKFLPSTAYTVEDFIRITLRTQEDEHGFCTWSNFSETELRTTTGGTTYQVSSKTYSKEDLIIAYSFADEIFDMVTDYTVTNDASGTQVVLGTGLPVGGVLVVNFSDRGNAPVSDIFVPSGLTYNIQEGYSIKIIGSSTITPDRFYSVSGSTLTFITEPTETFEVRYYPIIGNVNVSMFTRSTVIRNKAKFLLDRSRPDGIYDDYWNDDGDVVYMNRSGQAWAEPLDPGNEPVLANNVYVPRRLA